MAIHEIKLRIKDEDDLYSRFDIDKQIINSDVITYIKNRYNEKNFGDQIELNIISDAEINAENIKEALDRLVRKELDENLKQQKYNNFSFIRLVLIGVFFISAGIVLGYKLNAVPLEILSLIGGFAIKEAADIFFIKRPKNRLIQKKLLKLLEAEVRISC